MAMINIAMMHGDFANALRNLAEFNRLTIKTYSQALKKIKNKSYRVKLLEFKSHYEDQIDQILHLLEKHHNLQLSSFEPSSRDDIIYNAKDDKIILKALKKQEDESNIVYHHLNGRQDVWPDAEDVIKKGIAYEKDHRSWLDTMLSSR
jgi:hypothetical protein